MRSLLRPLIVLGLYSCSGHLCPAYAGTVTGTMTTANGVPVANGILTVTPSQFGLVSGTGALVPASVTCATSTDGSIVGLLNPQRAPVLSKNQAAGTLPAGTYFVVLAFYNAGGTTLASSESAIVLAGTGTLIVTPPALPVGATGMRVYISTATGTETLQGSTTGTAQFLQSSALVTGSALPATNTTVCSLIFNDQIIPSGTGYNVTLSTTAGQTYPGFPMMWQLNGGASGTVNVSNGLPLYSGTVIYPSPIQATPLSHGQQSISGPLDLGGYNLTGVGAINGVINAAAQAGGDIGAKINAAFTSCPGCTIYVPAGSYTVTTQIAANQANLHLQCAGALATTLTQGFTGDLIAVTADNFTLDGCGVDGAGFSTGWSLVHIQNSNNANIHGNRFVDSRTAAFNTLIGVRIEGLVSPANYSRIHDNYFTVPWIVFSTSTNANYNSFDNNTLVGCGEPFDFNGNAADSTANSFTNNAVTGGLGEAFLESVTGSIIEGNRFVGVGSGTNSTIMVHLASGTAMARTIIKGNLFSQGSGAAVTIADNTRDLLVEGNIFDGNRQDGIYVSDVAGAVTNLGILGNIFHNNGTSNSSAGFAAIRGNTVNAFTTWTIANNIAYDDQSTKSQTYGLALTGTGTASNFTVLGNDFVRNKTGAFLFSVVPGNSTIGPNREDVFNNSTFRSNLIPSSDGVLNLGQNGNRWNDLWLAGAIQRGGGFVITLPIATGTMGLVLNGTSASLGGGALASGACASNTTAVTGATTGMTVSVSPVADPGASIAWEGFVSAANTVTARICATAAVTPTATAYNIRVVE